MTEHRRHLLLVSWALLLALAASPPAGGQSPGQEEQQDYYRKWLLEDVVYLIDPNERAVFEKLSTPEERDQFIEQFWRRRDPNPATPENEFKEEHYRRIAYANEHFHSGVPGWKTDRGWVYIKYGPPQGLEKHPEGGFYARKHHEGGGFTSTYPFEVWFYRHIPGVGDGVEIEFVDPSKTNEYRIARDADEKDALLHVPGAGLTEGERLGTVSRLDRLRFRNMVDDLDFRYRRIQDFPFQRLQTLYGLEKAPVQQFKDLERIVDVRIHYQQLPLEVRTDEFQITPELGLVPVTLFVRNRDLSFRKVSAGSQRAFLEIYGRVETLGGRLEYAFEDTVQRDLPTDGNAAERGRTFYQKRLPLRVGRYKLSLVVREPATGKLSTTDHLLHVRRKPESELYASTLMLTPRAEPVQEDSFGEPFVLTTYRVPPVEDDEFSVADGFVQSFFEVYNLGVDQTTLQPAARVEISLLYWGAPGEELTEPHEVFPFTPLEDEFEFVADRLVVHKTIPFAGLIPGRYSVLFRITDEVKSASLDQRVDFRIRQ